MISQLLTAAVESYAAIDRASDRRDMTARARQRFEASKLTDNPRTFLTLRSPKDIRLQLPLVRTYSAVVLIDCALERCDSEDELLTLWSEAKRVTGESAHRDASGTVVREPNLFVVTIQHWSTARLFFDPRIRWVILTAPPKGELTYRPYGKRSRLLADVRVATRDQRDRERIATL